MPSMINSNEARPDGPNDDDSNAKQPTEWRSSKHDVHDALHDFSTKNDDATATVPDAQMMMQQEQQRQATASEMRREQMARDQQFMNQQTTLLRESFKRAGDGGFQGKMQQALEEKMIDELVNGKESSWKEDVKDVLGSDTLKDAVADLVAHSWLEAVA